MRSSLTAEIKTSHVITLHYYDITSQYIRYSGNNDKRWNIPIHIEK